MQSIRLFQRMLLALGLSLCFATAHAQLTAGKDYSVVKPPQPTESGNKIEVPALQQPATTAGSLAQTQTGRCRIQAYAGGVPGFLDPADQGVLHH